jgi:4-hydroxy-3-methylbut-2-enyl diphosphate reductase
MIKKIHLARHYGFCMGVKRAIKIAEETAKSASGPVTILNEIVHNEAVVQKFRDEGVGQSMSLREIGGGTVIISAHGVAPHIFEEAAELGLEVIDATCPLVTVIYDVVKDKVAQDYYVIHFGDANHDETIGVVGHAPDRITVVATETELHALPDWKERKLVLTVQTTSSMEEFAGLQELAKIKWPHLEISDTICNATTQRQTAIREMAPHVDLILVVGSTTSANSKRLALLAQELTGRGYLIGSALDVRKEWFHESIENVGISAGASTPDALVEAVIQKLIKYSGGTAELIKPEKKRRNREQVEELH